jgi:signal transduction histidine kinase/CheY-like chemotaxis protein
VTRTFTGGQPQTMVESNQSGPHTMLSVQIKTFPLRDHAGQVSAVIVILNDISTQKRLEAQLLQSQKMEAIGLLAGGVAHDFNNILSAIIGYASILQMKIPSDAPLRPNVDQVLAAAQRAASLTQGLLAFSRKQIINPKPLEVNDRVRRIERLLRRIIGEDIDLAVRYASEDRTILMDAGQLEQVIINLATNARDAMPAGGVLRIETGTAAMDAEFIGRHGFGQAGHYAVITVSDTGTGMDEQTRMHIFEPFFTTKEIGKGTGLGLSTVYGIVKQNNGFILCDSEPGSGSTFRLYFPLAGEAPGADAAAAPPLAPGGSETILIAEDDEMIRDLFRMVFTDNGYQVLTAGDGDEALAEFRKHPADIDLLVIDVIMPKKNGRDLYEEVRRIRPGIKVLFTSGYTDNIVHKQGLLDEGIHFVTKPVELAAMLKRVRDILDSR